MPHPKEPLAASADNSLAGWHHLLSKQAVLEVVAAVPLPPPAIGSACILQGTIPEFHRQDPAILSISFLLEGNPVVERRHGSKIIRQAVSPGGFGIAPAGGHYEFRTEGQHTSLNLAMADETVQQFAERELDHHGPRVDLRACLDARSPKEVVALGQAFARLVRTPRQGAALYAETLWTQIAIQLLWHHSSLTPPTGTQETAALADRRVADVIAYLEANLARDTSLSDLAALVKLSPAHFLRAFKKATGRTPLRYRAELRAARACELLHDPALNMTDIALSLGYASHSHFCTSFRRLRGVSPSAYRAGIRQQRGDRG